MSPNFLSTLNLNYLNVGAAVVGSPLFEDNRLILAYSAGYRLQVTRKTKRQSIFCRKIKRSAFTNFWLL